MTHSKSYWRGYLDETNFGGGSAGAAYAKTEPANTAALSSLPQPFNEVNVMPTAVYEQVAMESAGQPGDSKTTFTTDKTIVDGKLSQIMNGIVFLGHALSTIIDDDEGSIPKSSWCEINYDGQRLKSAYGCYIKDHTISVPKPTDLPKETVAYSAFDVIDVVTGANFATAKAWGGTPYRHKDFAFYIDGSVLTDWDSAEIAVKNEWTDKQAGNFLNYYPRLKKTDITLSLSSFNYLGCLDDGETETADLFDIFVAIGSPLITTESGSDASTDTIIYVTNGSADNDAYNGKFMIIEGQVREIDAYVGATKAATLGAVLSGAPANGCALIIADHVLSLHEMKIDPKSININEMPEKGMKLYSADFEIGGDCDIDLD
ncbi:MAG: hypothetical protein WC309_04035 [Candidatus Paceibacterota bacterium]